MVVPRGRTPRKKWSCRWPNCSKCAQPKKRLYCTVHYQEYLRGQDNNAAESLASIRNNSANNEPRDVSAVGNVGGDHAINNNNRDVALVNVVCRVNVWQLKTGCLLRRLFELKLQNYSSAKL